VLSRRQTSSNAGTLEPLVYGGMGDSTSPAHSGSSVRSAQAMCKRTTAIDADEVGSLQLEKCRAYDVASFERASGCSCSNHHHLAISIQVPKLLFTFSLGIQEQDVATRSHEGFRVPDVPHGNHHLSSSPICPWPISNPDSHALCEYTQKSYLNWCPPDPSTNTACIK
jgi:hypothetical protein